MKLALPLCAALAAGLAAAAPPGASELPWAPRSPSWRTDAAWYDGRAELCVYDATRTIYGVERSYEARAYPNKQRMDPGRGVKAEGAEGVEVFKHHWSERVPTERYDYDFSTATFTRTDDLAPFKLTAATQDDCGASFKQIVRDGEALACYESVYFPGTGVARGRIAPRDARRTQLADALTLVLRDFPFGERESAELSLVPSQKDTRRVPFEPAVHTVRYAGREPLALPSGDLEAHRLELADASGAVVARYWFAADGGATWLHALLCYEGPNGATYRLRSLERTAYWER
jgi:hypothetical protein